MAGARRIIVGVSGTPCNLPAVRHAAELAHIYGAVFVPVHAWVPPGPEAAHYQFICEPLIQEWQDAARKRLQHGLDMAFGGLPSELPAEPLTAQGNAGPVLVNVAGRTDDMLVIGTGRRGAVSRMWHGTVSRYCLAHARCPVIAIPPPALGLATGPGMRGWARRHKIPAPHDIVAATRQVS